MRLFELVTVLALFLQSNVLVSATSASGVDALSIERLERRHSSSEPNLVASRRHLRARTYEKPNTQPACGGDDDKKKKPHGDKPPKHDDPHHGGGNDEGSDDATVSIIILEEGGNTVIKEQGNLLPPPILVAKANGTQHYICKNQNYIPHTASAVLMNKDGRALGTYKRALGIHTFHVPHSYTDGVSGWFIGTKSEWMPSPNGPKNLPWLKINRKLGGLAKRALQVKTVGGMPPLHKCEYDNQEFDVTYTAEYLFFHK